MSSKREQIIAAVVAALAAIPAAVERDADIPESVSPAGLLIVRSAAAEIEDETLGSSRSWYMRLAVPVEIYVTGPDAAIRAARIDTLATLVATTLAGNAPLLALSTYVETTITDLEAIAGDGQTTFAAARVTARVEYDAESSIG